MNFYLLPVERIGKRRGPRYLKWRANPAGLDMRWSLKDFGSDSSIALVATDSMLRQNDALAVSDWSSKARDHVAAYLKNANIESRWILQAESAREAVQRIAGVTQAMQAGNGDPSLWLGREIYFGFDKLGIFDLSLQRCEVVARAEALRVKWLPARNLSWGDLLRIAASNPLAALLMALPATDVFTAANGTLLTTYSASWTQNNGQFKINTNAVYPNSGGAEIGAHWNADTFANDQYAQGKHIADDSAAVAVGVACRVAASGETYYGFYTSSGASYLFKDVGGTWTQLGSDGTSFSANDVVRIEANGTTITPKRNGSTDGIGAQTDDAIASGYAGLAGYGDSTGTRIDDWEGGNLSTTTAKTGTDSASLSEVSGVIAATLPGTDSAVLAELSAVALSTTDSASVSETGAINATLPPTDSASESESSSISADISGSDNATQGEAYALAADLPASDSANESESGSLAATLAEQDSSALAESSSLSKDLSLADSASASESGTIAADLESVDSATASESGSIQAALAESDNVTASEESSIGAALALNDNSAASESESIQAALAASDDASASEDGAISATLAGLDAANSSEERAILATLTESDGDSAVLSEASALNAGGDVSDVDAASLSESSLIDKVLEESDSAIVSEASALVAAVVAALDNGTLSESSAAPGVVVSGSDGATLTEACQIDAVLSAAETFVVTESGAMWTSATYAPRLIPNVKRQLAPQSVPVLIPKAKRRLTLQNIDRTRTNKDVRIKP